MRRDRALLVLLTPEARSWLRVVRGVARAGARAHSGGQGIVDIGHYAAAVRAISREVVAGCTEVYAVAHRETVGAQK